MRLETVISVSVAVLVSLASCDDAKPETIYLPYSETEDVDFTIARPSNIGCYQWYVHLLPKLLQTYLYFIIQDDRKRRCY